MKKYVVVLWHMAYWCMYSLLVLLVWAGGIDHSHPLRLEGMAAVRLLLHVLFLPPYSFLAFWPGVLGFYAFYFILFNVFLSKKKVLKLVLSSILVVCLIPVLLISLLMFLKPDFHGEIIAPGIAIAIIAGINGILGLVLRGFITWYRDIKLKMELDKKNYDMEIALIKAQINPHFLFNTINNIDVLIQKDAAKASLYLNKLSDMMRFMLYETKTGKITLEKELSYIQKYVDLQKIRTSNQNYIVYEVKGTAGEKMIEPMLFIPFIENAFKHTENKRLENAIKIGFVIEEDKITFECENAYWAETSLKPEHSGLGNELIQRRLVLLYPNKHTINLSNNNGIYKVNLVLSI